MLREQEKFVTRAHKLLDICLTAIAFIGAYFIKKDLLPSSFLGLTTAPNYYIVLLMIIIIWYATFELCGLYDSYRKQSLAQMIKNMFRAVSIGMLVMILCMYVFKIKDVSRIMLGIFYCSNIGLLALSKGFVFIVLSRIRQNGFNFRSILVVGSKEGAKDMIKAISEHGDASYRIIGCLEVDQNEVGKEVNRGIKVIGTIESMDTVFDNQVVDELVFCMPLKKIEDAEKYMALAEEIGVSVRILPDWHIQRLGYRPKIASLRFEEFMGMNTMTLSTTPYRGADLLIKSFVDYISACICLAFFLPLFVVVSCAIKLSSKGPVFFIQERSGSNGRKFMLYKFRTMAADAEERRREIEALNESDGPAFKVKRDPRIIPFVGTLLRKMSLDELPQFFNVLKGEMSLVGPRPPIPSEVEKYDIWQRRRLSMKPGMTCLWQVTPNRNDLSFEEWMNMDLEYIDSWSLGLDFKILLMTVLAVLRGEGR
ncbi:MAG: sugar transferase [Thermodesulfobacteriota bacterium]|nr:sugar transferase [Thermodesulfobacteriota bacterium]